MKNPRAGELIRYSTDHTFIHRAELANDIALILEVDIKHIKVRWLNNCVETVYVQDEYIDFDKVDDA
jgi:hypothetical protein